MCHFFYYSCANIIYPILSNCEYRTIQARLTPLGYCQITASNPPATAVPLSSCAGGIPAAAIYASITIETTPIRYRDDGTNPTAALGMPLVQGQNILYTGNKLSALVFVASIAGTATINVAFYGV